MLYASHLVHSHRPTMKVGDHTTLHERYGKSEYRGLYNNGVWFKRLLLPISSTGEFFVSLLSCLSSIIASYNGLLDEIGILTVFTHHRPI